MGQRGARCLSRRVVGVIATLGTAAAAATMAPSVVYRFALLTMAVVLIVGSRTGGRVIARRRVAVPPTPRRGQVLKYSGLQGLQDAEVRVVGFCTLTKSDV